MSLDVFLATKPKRRLHTRLHPVDILHKTLLASSMRLITPMPEGRFMETFRHGEEVWFRYTFKMTNENNPFEGASDATIQNGDDS